MLISATLPVSVIVARILSYSFLAWLIPIMKIILILLHSQKPVLIFRGIKVSLVLNITRCSSFHSTQTHMQTANMNTGSEQSLPLL